MVKAEPTSYEEIRQQRIKENKKRMDELNLTKLTQALRNASPKPSPMKRTKPHITHKEMGLIEVRRSSRVADLPAPVYREVSLDVIGRPRSRYLTKGRGLSSTVYASDEDRINAIERAEELQSKLVIGFPSFVRPMLPSHVTGCFWLGLPSDFCKKNLPNHDETITLVDESGDEWPTVYIARRTGLSGGWRGFSIEHELVDGDALVFELVELTKFKVHIIKGTVQEMQIEFPLTSGPALSED